MELQPLAERMAAVAVTGFAVALFVFIAVSLAYACYLAGAQS